VLTSLQIAKLVTALDVGPGADIVWVFGSQARGTATDDSDVDVAALFRREPTADELVTMRASLAEHLGRPVDLVDLDRAGPVVAMQVARHGVLVLDRVPSRRVRFLTALPSRYDDIRRLCAPIERAIIDRLGDGRA
jgi:predicted nucleotidyltransferase